MTCGMVFQFGGLLREKIIYRIFTFFLLMIAFLENSALRERDKPEIESIRIYTKGQISKLNEK